PRQGGRTPTVLPKVIKLSNKWDPSNRDSGSSLVPEKLRRQQQHDISLCVPAHLNLTSMFGHLSEHVGQP
ncbi:hypothetical protein PIB30_115801, partial [Stylosanthes scabra]|nr:hypothetical protein [Stylosanthes scabra]